MLLSISPEPEVLSVALPLIDAIAVLSVVVILSLIDSPISPPVDSDTLHIVLFPLSLVPPSILPAVHADADDHILLPLSCE